MRPSEKIELEIYRLIKGVGRSRSVTIGELSAAVNPNADFEILIERLMDLNNMRRIELFKVGGGGIRVPYLTFAEIEGKTTFFYQGSFLIEVAPSGRKYFEDLESHEKSEQVKPAERRDNPPNLYPETRKSMRSNRKKMIIDLIDNARKVRFCSPSGDPEQQMAVTTAYRHLVIQFQKLVGPILPEIAANQLKSIDVDVDDIRSVYDARAHLDALLPDVEDALELHDEPGMAAGANLWIVDPALISRLVGLESSSVDAATLVRICKEINLSCAHGNVLATVLLMRTVLNHVPPVFNQNSFEQVLANIGKSLKESFDHLENGLRKVADFHAHRRIGSSEFYPSMAQVEPFKPQFELLIQEVLKRLK
ncbi:MAG: hypothetical protein WCD49_12500 [Candidatus Acidiferrales bacterium]